ncbi:hypothetical protein FRC06_005783, partial [Ceratobasidium sp. 370]
MNFVERPLPLEAGRNAADTSHNGTDIQVDVRFIGANACGKTSVIKTHVGGKSFVTLPLVDVAEGLDLYHHAVVIPPHNVRLRIRDTANRENSDGPHINSYSQTNTDIVVIMFNIGDPQGIDDLGETFIPEVNRFFPEAPKLLVGCQLDCRASPNSQGSISHRTGVSAAKLMGAWGYAECSARSGAGVADLFDAIARMAVIVKTEPRPKRWMRFF